jgi:hypothetical protein
MSRIILPGLAVLALLGSSLVRADDLAEIKARQIIAAQKLKSQVTDALVSSRKLELTKPMDARLLIERTLRDVEASQDLAATDKESLQRQLRARLTEVNNAVRKTAVEQEQKPVRDIDRTRTSPSSGNSVGGSSGGSISDLAKSRIDATKGTQASIRDTVRERQQSIAKVHSSAESGSIPTDEPFTLPKNWKQISESRAKMFGPQLTEKEAKILKTLNSTISVDYPGDAKFKTVLEDLQDRTGLTMIVDQASAQDLNLDYDDTVKLQLKKVTVRTAIKKVLGDKGLTYIIKEGALQVMTPKRASEYTVVRSYPIEGLVAPTQVAMQFGPFVARAQMLANVQSLISMIQGSIEPSYWQPNGPGSIAFFEPTMSITIRASAEMHYQMRGLGR